MNSLDKTTRSLDLQPAVPIGPGSEMSDGATPIERPLISPDRLGGPDELGRTEDAIFLAEVTLHRRLDTPFCLGLFGAAGSGKTFFLNELLGAVERLGAVAEPDGPFVGGALVVRIDAARPVEPAPLLVEAVLDRVAELHPALAAELVHAGADPAEAVREANEALNAVRQRHQAERDQLDVLQSREARLTESVLEAPGSSIDTYARAHRSTIERSLRRFGFDAAEPIGTYKALVREAADSPGRSARTGLGLRALWAYGGQTSLLLWAALLGLFAWFLSALASDGDAWIASLRDMGDKAAPLADWAQAHIHSLGPVRSIAVLLCILALALNLWRAQRFLWPIFTGAGLLRHDLEGRSRDLQGLLAHQTRRVDGLGTEVEEAARRASEAERRAGRHRSPAEKVRKGASADRSSQAGAVFEALAAAPGAPGRIIVALDNLDARTSAQAAALMEAARQLLGPGFVCIAAVDRHHLTEGFGETDPARAFAQVERCVDLGFRVDADGTHRPAWSAFAARLLGDRQPLPAAARPDIKRSSLDRPWRLREAETVAALSSFAGETPRAIKRYVNLYRIARADPHLRDAAAPVFTALALALALDSHGFRDELAALAKASHGEAAGEATVLRRALVAAREASGEPVELAQAQRGIEAARRYAARA